MGNKYRFNATEYPAHAYAFPAGESKEEWLEWAWRRIESRQAYIQEFRAEYEREYGADWYDVNPMKSDIDEASDIIMIAHFNA